ncbi:MAG: AAA family ATPase [Pedobacter sp.]|nr:MAG: AAA family ATPase [Pedobacter sp.]
MKINRENLLVELYDFALEGSGMVVGKPGIGKSYLLQQLQGRLVENGILCLVIKIDNAFDSSDQAIQAELTLDQDWIDTLKQVELNEGHKAVLIFDAFDAARDEEKRKGFLTQIKRAKSLLQHKWNIIVSVRTYDASKSKELEHIFSRSKSEPVPRKKYIHELTDEEVGQAVAGDSYFSSLYEQSSIELKDILHVPFFLKILEDILRKSNIVDLDAIRTFRSEIQLLEAYWQTSIVDTVRHAAKEKFLAGFTALLVEHRSLNYQKTALFSKMDESQVGVFDYLRSENIIDEVSLNNSRVSFSHNILFDYAVSRYCLIDDYKKLLDFITTDTSRPFFFRPSFIYFFTALWYGERNVFWTIYKQLAGNPQKEIKLFVRLIVNGTIAAEYHSFTDLEPIFEKLGGAETDENVSNFLQSVRFIRSETASKDIQLFKIISRKLQIRFLFEFAFLLDRAISEPEGHLIADNGISARNLMNFIFVHRLGDFKAHVDRIGATRGVELVAKTYGTQPNESGNVLKKVFELIHEPGFEIYYFTNLAEYIKYILPFDPKFVAEVYYVIFDHTEDSEEKTSMGNGVVMNLISNRRQDFEMCYYRLQTFFPEFLQAAPVLATSTGIEILNRHLINKKVRLHGEDAVQFEYKGLKAVILPDYSSIWADRRFGSKHEAMGQHVIDYIEKLLIEKRIEQAREILFVYISKSQVGYLWKLVFRLAAKFPEELFEDIYPLVLVPQILFASETNFEVLEFVRSISGLLKDAQIEAIETAIFNAFPKEYDYSIQQSLSMLPKDRLQLDKSRKFMASREVVENEPRYKSSSSVTAYTNDMWLAEQGVDLSDETNRQLTENINKLEEFNHVFLNDQVSYPEHKEKLALAIQTFQEIEKNQELAPDLSYSILNAVAKTAVIFSKDFTEISDANFQEIKKIVLFSYEYLSPYDEDQNSNSARSGYSPTPRIEASSALINIFVHDQENATFELVKNAVNHINGIIRFNVIRELPKLFNKFYQQYSEILFTRLKSENDSFVYAGILSAIYFKKDRVHEDGKKVIELANEKTQLLTTRNEFVEAYAELLLWFIGNHDVTLALQTLRNAYLHKEFCTTIVFKLFKTIQTFEPRDEFLTNLLKHQVKISIIEHYVDEAREQMETDGDNFDLNTPSNKVAIDLFDEVVLRIYFALESKQRIGRSLDLDANEENRKDLYFMVKPVLLKIIAVSGTITNRGLIIGHTAHYFIQCLNSVLHFDPKDILKMMANITKYSVQAGYTFDSFAIREIVKLTEQLLADHRHLLLEDGCFNDLLSILDIYINSGWVDALELLWKLDEIFK